MAISLLKGRIFVINHPPIKKHGKFEISISFFAQKQFLHPYQPQIPQKHLEILAIAGAYQNMPMVGIVKYSDQL